jgi:hypothetical protein
MTVVVQDLFVYGVDDEDGGNVRRVKRLIQLFCDCLEGLKKTAKRLCP